MCNAIIIYFKGNYKIQSNKRKSISERSDTNRSEQTDQRMSGAIIVDHIRYGASRSEQTELRGMLRLEQSRVKASGEKHGRSERSENIM